MGTPDKGGALVVLPGGRGPEYGRTGGSTLSDLTALSVPGTELLYIKILIVSQPPFLY
jgi:hypothetical protein